MTTSDGLRNAQCEGELDISSEYHQDYPGPQWKLLDSATSLIPLCLVAFALTYQAFYALDYDLLPLQQLLWNSLVYLTPDFVLDWLESYRNTSGVPLPKLKTRNQPRTRAAKSVAMQRILGIDKPGGFISTVAEVGRKGLASLPVMGLTTRGADAGRPLGLGNWDNSCYQNSVLQGLSSLDTLPEYLSLSDRRDGHLENENTNHPSMRTTQALRELLVNLNDPSPSSHRIWTPDALKAMSSWQQQDAQEYYSKVLDEVDKEVGKAFEEAKIVDGLQSTGLSLENRKSKPSDDNSAYTIRNPLEGLIAQRVACMNCGHSEGLSMIPFNCLTVPLGKAWEQDLSECLNEYTKLEMIEGVECAKCTLLKHQRLLSALWERLKDASEDDILRKHTAQRLEAVDLAIKEENFDDRTLLQKCNVQSNSRVTSTKSKQAVIARPPRSFVVHVNRSMFDESSGVMLKNYSEVRFPKVLDLGPWCLGSVGPENNLSTEEWILSAGQSMIANSKGESLQRGPLYELRAIVTHYGRHENGHYLCYKSNRKSINSEHDSEGQWWCLSDDDVDRFSEQKMLRQGGVFMLFYDCVDTVTPSITDVDQNVQGPSVAGYTSLPDVATAATIPLPLGDDSDLLEVDSQEPFLATREESTATSVSELDDEEYDTLEPPQYQPTQAILVPPYMASSGRHAGGEESEVQGHMISNLVMV